MGDIYRDLAGIGVEVSGVKPNRRADIERTILHATELVNFGDRRLLGFLASWIVVHGGLVSIGKIKHLIKTEKRGDRQVLSALAHIALENKFHVWKPLAGKFPQRVLWDSDNTRSALELRGSDPVLIKAGVRFPAGFLRIRTSDVLPIETLAKRHLQVRLRLIFGVNPRADAAFYLSFESLNANALKRRIGCSYEPANRIIREFREAGSLALPELNLQ
ncbi:MAG: hypothetical protein J5J00_11100 [Deltaproteobacteria bacterium]|nr:hypothetical protein [Deltaproteobacteria bacterium]